MPAKNLTLAEVKSAVESANDVIERWEVAGTDDAPHVQWRGKARKAISDAMVEAWESLFDRCDTQDVDANAQSTVLAIDEFRDAMDAWAELCELSPEEADPSGSRELWNAWAEIARTLEPRPVKRLEPIEELVIQKVTERQIAIIYGWTQADGSPDIQKVREERAKPGTHYNAKTWVHPEDAKLAQETAERWAKRSARVSSGGSQTEGSCPETLDELIAQDVPSKQIAAMKGITVEEVKQRARELGVAIDGQFVPSVSPHDRQQDIREQDAQRKAEIQRLVDESRQQQAQQPAESPSPGSLPERVVAMADSGLSQQQIAEQLQADHPSMTADKVGKILKSAKKEPATA